MQTDLNCDMGESFGVYSVGADEMLMSVITSANVACGFHAGDPIVLDRTVALARRHAVAVGAHPGYPDLAGFGRRSMDLSPQEVEAGVLYQVAAVAGFCRAHGVPLVHVKPHGALYNAAAHSSVLAAAIAQAVARFDAHLILVGLATSETCREAAASAGLRFAGEAFADRVYQADGSLLPRSRPGAVFSEPERAAKQAVDIAAGFVESHDGTRVPVRAETLCLHGDNPAAVHHATAVRAALAAAGVDIAPLEHHRPE
jgi:5-oxoprolinase (ATP-hydrolysing) subunit A